MSTSNPSPNPTLRILLVEDSPSDADVLQELLADAGSVPYAFTRVDRLDDALARLAREHFDAMLLDLTLPDSTGADTFRRARLGAPRLPIVVMTGAHDRELGVTAVREGIQDYLVKGADGPQTDRAIRYAIERKQAEEKLRQLNRTLAALSKSSQAMIRATEELPYVAEVCRIIAEDCGHALVWVGYAEDDEARAIRPVAWAGEEHGYLQTLRLTWADTERGRGPTGTAIRTGRPDLCRDMAADLRAEPWREEALQRGFASSLALPLMAGDRALGALSLYARQAGVLSDEEVRLLTELADDLAYGIRTLRLRAAHAQAQASIRASELRLATLIKSAPVGIVLYGADGAILKANPTAQRLFGRTVQEMAQAAGDSGWAFVREDGSPMPPQEHPLPIVLSSRQPLMDYVMGLRRPWSNDTVWVLVNTVPLRGADGAVSEIVSTSVEITERRRMEAALRQSEELARARLEEIEVYYHSAPVGLCVLDPQLRFLRLNRRMAEVNGLPVDAHLGRTVGEVVPAWAEHAQVLLGQILVSGGPVRDSEFTRETPGPAGARRTCLESWYPLRDAAGKVSGVNVVVNDITELRDAQRWAMESLAAATAARTAQHTIAAMTEGVSLTDLAGHILLMNPAMEELLGRPCDELIGTTIASVLGGALEPDALRAILEAPAELRQGRTPSLPPVRLTREDGRTVTVVPSVALVGGSDAPSASMVLTLLDISELRRAQEATEQSERKYHELVESANSIIMRRRPDGTITFFNRYAQEFFGYAAHEILGANIVGTIVPEADAAGRDLAAVARAIGRDPDAYANHESENRCRDGRRVWVQWTNRALRNGRGEIVELLCVGNDATERRKADEDRLRYQGRLQSLARKLAQTEEEERRRVSRYIHDAVVQGLSLANIRMGSVRDALEKAALREELTKVDVARELLGTAIAECRRLMSDLTPPMLYELGLESALDDLAEKLRRQHGADLEFEDDGQPKPMSYALRGLLYQSARELIVNALKYAGPCRIRVSVARAGDAVRVSVCDDGAGFDTGEEGAAVRNGGGFGLLNARECLEGLDGSLEVTSKPGRGTTAVLVAPLMREGETV